MPKLTLTDQTPGSLRALADQIMEASAAIRTIGDAMDQTGVKMLPVPNSTILMRALDDLDSYVSAGRKALRQVRGTRGDFQAAGGEKKKRTKAE